MTKSPVSAADLRSIERAAALLAAGGVVAFPTETVYGLGASAFDARAVARVFDIKRRPSFDPLIVHVSDGEMLARVSAPLSDLAKRLADRFWPGPLTIVLPKAEAVPAIVTAGLPSVAVRMPSHPVARALIERAGVPIAAPSANPFGYISPTRASHVERMLGSSVDLILDGGPTEHGLESTIVRLGERPAILRYGAIARETLEEVAGPLLDESVREDAPLAPGQLAHHYAPRTPLRMVSFAGVPGETRVAAAALAFGDAPRGYHVTQNLSASRDLREAAANLFDALHQLDEAGVERIDVELFPAQGLGHAINDRLRRAAAR